MIYIYIVFRIIEMFHFVSHFLYLANRFLYIYNKIKISYSLKYNNFHKWIYKQHTIYDSSCLFLIISRKSIFR